MAFDVNHEYEYYLLQRHQLTLRMKSPAPRPIDSKGPVDVGDEPQECFQYANTSDSSIYLASDYQQKIQQQLENDSSPPPPPQLYFSLEIEALINQEWIRFIVADEDIQKLKSVVSDPVTQQSIEEVEQNRELEKTRQLEEEEQKEEEMLASEMELEDGKRPTLEQSFDRIHRDLIIVFYGYIAIICAVFLLAIPMWAVEKSEGWGYGVTVYFIVVTLCTVGYGDYTPKKPGGRALDCIIIVIGVPLLGLWLALVSTKYISITTHSFNIFCHAVLDKEIDYDAQAVTNNNDAVVTPNNVGPTNEQPCGNNIYDSSMYVNVAQLSMEDNVLGNRNPNVPNDLNTPNQVKSSGKTRSWFQRHRRVREKLQEILTSESFMICLQVFIIISYVLIGSAVFTAIEHWNFGEGLYFSLISLSTIGYGDVLVTTRAGRVLLCFYLLIGIGLLAVLIGMGLDVYKRRIKKHVTKMIEKRRARRALRKEKEEKRESQTEAVTQPSQP